MAKTVQTASGKIEALQQESRAEIKSIADPDALEEFRVKWLGRKGILTDVLRSVSKAPPEERGALGKEANQVKAPLLEEIEAKKMEFAPDKGRIIHFSATLAASFSTTAKATVTGPPVDFSLPGRVPPRGHLHVITQVTDEIVDIFSELGIRSRRAPTSRPNTTTSIRLTRRRTIRRATRTTPST